ncbi:hypothetical protein BC739_002141 [Kutzneria viridogrisea]|uniref:Phosphodiester glycosidase domain-containing protein n=1 Tax=Kutzneria viridogrisea TaxID=47990 RepID=A0ABR6BDL5_9PSEU|nr:phosphodiester glycosidase family protein [Kutzneria albida]MBA8924942.1 hypothetical protein [Kutzneria viridogrisea]
MTVTSMLVATVGLGWTSPAGAAPPAAADSQDSEPVGPGTTLTDFSQTFEGIPLRGNVLDADLGDPRLSVGLLTPPVVGQAQTVTEMATAQHAIAAVNGDFFDINNTGSTLGIEVQGGTLRKGPQTDPSPWHHAVGVDAGRVGRIVEAYLDGQVVLPGGKYRLDGLNQVQVPAGAGLGVFTPLWGTASRAFLGSPRTHEVTVSGGRVVRHGADRIPGDGFVLAGTGSEADLLAALPVGAPVGVSYAPRTEPDHRFDTLMGARDVLVRAGVADQTLDDTSVNPETAIGFSQDGKHMMLVVIDGRSAVSKGVTERQLARWMQQRGAYEAVVVDGGGSSELISRDAGGTSTSVRNVPSDGVERPVGNGIGLFSAPGSGHLTGIRLGKVPAVFTGLHRRLTATGYDETYGPARTGALRWTGADQDGVLTGGSPGTAQVSVTSRGVRGSGSVRVLPALTRIAVPQVDLTGGRPAGFTVTGYDAAGESSAVDPCDVRLDYDRDLIRITPRADGSFAVKALADKAFTTVTAQVGDRVTTFPVAVGLESEPVTGFEDAGSWKFGSARGSGSLASVPGRHGNALGMSVDFTASEQTRTGVATAPAPIPVPGRAHGFEMSVNGDGRGGWLAVLISDANGRNYSVYGDYVTWNGWRRTRFTVPDGVAYPVAVRGVEEIEAKRIHRYTGHLDFDDLTAQVSPRT